MPRGSRFAIKWPLILYARINLRARIESKVEFINESVNYLKLKTKWTGSGLKTKLINLENKKTIIKINPKLFRPAEVNYLRGNFSKAYKKLRWIPKTNLKKLVKIMIDEEIKYYN